MSEVHGMLYRDVPPEVDRELRVASLKKWVVGNLGFVPIEFRNMDGWGRHGMFAVDGPGRMLILFVEWDGDEVYYAFEVARHLGE